MFGAIRTTNAEVRNLGLINVQVTSHDQIGGLVRLRREEGIITACYVTASVSGNAHIGGLVGGSFVGGHITASYATASVSGRSGQIGGLVGVSEGTITASYFDTNTTGQTAGGTGYTTTQLQMPTNYTGIYLNWNVDVDNGFIRDVDNGSMAGDTTADMPWDFGTTSQYPRLKVDFNGDGVATVAEFGSQ